MIKVSVLFILLFYCNNLSVFGQNVKPLVLWHGMGDSCCFSFSLGKFEKFLKSATELSGVYVKSLQIGHNVVEDVENGYFMSPNKQVEEACKIISADPNLKDGYNAIGFSQGGQFLRAVAQRCPVPAMSTLVTLGGQHQGIFGLPQCPSLTVRTCKYFRNLLNHVAYLGWVQHFLVQATYWHDPLQEEQYREASGFLADINNERQVNSDYVANLQALDKFVMVKFSNDSMVEPRETEWFGFYAPNQDKVVQTLQESDFYMQDRLGLQVMDKDNKLVFLESPGNHLQFTEKWFIDNVIPYLH